MESGARGGGRRRGGRGRGGGGGGRGRGGGDQQRGGGVEDVRRPGKPAQRQHRQQPQQVTAAQAEKRDGASPPTASAQDASAPAAGRTFQEASAQIHANLQKHLDRIPSSSAFSASSSDDEDDSDENKKNGIGSTVSEEVMDRVFRSYDSGGGGVDSRTRQAIAGSMQKGHSACLICISSIKKQDAIWNCQNCFCSFHISCIQRWAKDSIFQQKNDMENEFPDLSSAPPHQQQDRDRVLQWGCPKCRHAHTPAQIPTRYDCYCGRLTDPPFDPWLVPHSCGETCGRRLDPECGHTCLILCHPGPCPPCPKMVTSACHCSNTAPATRRCFDRSWSCGKPCGRMLNCGQHPCPRPCHPGDCEPCQRTSVQLCLCRRSSQQTRCATPEWRCEEKCGKPLGCGHHMCDTVCHQGPCPPCPLSELRRCPCGRSTHRLPCTLATPTCGDTCGKTLSCGEHVCAERCHRGECGQCLQMVLKVCRCGNKQKEVTCTRQYTCDLKCKRLRDCRKHACNRKCCDGDCPPCEQSCSKTLSCKNHKCASRCHMGACYPCNQTKEVACSCGSSRLLVPCGREKATPPPKCRLKCQTPPDCHHEAREAHRCHFGPCPSCRQPCRKKMTCGHSCAALCHDKVKVVSSGPKASVPWEETGPRSEIKSLKCPDCMEPVPVTCLGAHETADWPCHAAKVGPCGRKCGRALPCGNHSCTRDCHRVKHAADDATAGSNCRKCESECLKQRPDGCAHPCPRPCHPGQCDACKQMVRIWCHCGLTQLYVGCGEWTMADAPEEKDRLACCQNQCPKIMECGHRCTKTCHSGDCSSSSSCKKRTKVFCPCKRRKEERPCHSSKAAGCDEECSRVKREARDAEEREEKRRREEEERRQREELERFEKKQEGRRNRRRDRRNRSETVEEGFFARRKFLVLGAAVVAIAGAAAAWYFMETDVGESAAVPVEKEDAT